MNFSQQCNCSSLFCIMGFKWKLLLSHYIRYLLLASVFREANKQLSLLKWLCSSSLDVPHLSSGRRWRVVKSPLHPETRSLTSGPWAGSWTVRTELHSHLRTTNHVKLQPYLNTLNPKWWSRLEIDPLLLKAELLVWDNNSVHTPVAVGAQRDLNEASW